MVAFEIEIQIFWVLEVKVMGPFPPLHFLVGHLSLAFLVAVSNVVLGGFPGQSLCGFDV